MNTNRNIDYIDLPLFMYKQQSRMIQIQPGVTAILPPKRSALSLLNLQRAAHAAMVFLTFIMFAAAAIGFVLLKGGH